MSNVNVLNQHIELLFQFWNGEISEETFQERNLLPISKEVDSEMQHDRFY